MTTSTPTWRHAWLALALLVVPLHCYLLYSTNPPSPITFPYADKVAHFCIFGGVAGLFALAGVARRVIVPVALVHAVESEIVQYLWVPGRSGSPWDALADLVGVGFALWLAGVILRARFGSTAQSPA